MKEIKKIIVPILFAFCMMLTGCTQGVEEQKDDKTKQGFTEVSNVDGFTDEEKEFIGKPYIILNDNEPVFSETDYQTTAFEEYSELDSLGRCGVAFANIGQELMPTKKRESIGAVKPSGWKTIKYDCVDGKYLYNRCHLIGYQLTAENANEENLITGTRYLNIEGMLPFENMVADYIKETGNHVLYRVTPEFAEDNLVASGVQMEAESVEDKGDGICFNIFAFNNQPGVSIDYVAGESSLASEKLSDSEMENEQAENDKTEDKYVLNTNTHKFHKLSCSSVEDIKKENKEIFEGSREELLEKGYEPCKRCNP